MFPDLKFVVTDGVAACKQNLPGWFDGDAAGVGMGNKLIRAEVIAQNAYAGLQLAAQNALVLVKSIANR